LHREFAAAQQPRSCIFSWLWLPLPAAVALVGSTGLGCWHASPGCLLSSQEQFGLPGKCRCTFVAGGLDKSSCLHFQTWYVMPMLLNAVPSMARTVCLLLQFSPGPGSSSITVHRLKSWYHFWSDVVITTHPVVATPLPLPPRPLVLAVTTRASPLVQAVHTAADLKVSCQLTC
jgi:hypothetical protein